MDKPLRIMRDQYAEGGDKAQTIECGNMAGRMRVFHCAKKIGYVAGYANG